MNTLFEDHIFSVEDLTQLIKQTLEGSFFGLTVEGEIFNFRPAASGHWYFELHDSEAAIQAVMFKSKSWRVPFIPKNGDRIIITGGVSVYAKRGIYQIICETMKLAGTGDLLALLEQRKRAFAAAGYFDAERKRPLPSYPKRVGVVTSPTGAAIRDILQVLKRRNPTIDVVVLPALVQGENAGSQIAAQIENANRFNLADVLIVGRGGGSLEDLFPFSDQRVIEAIVASNIPIISAVGHETDWALSDYAADMRAPTPSAAAELVSPPLSEILQAYTSRIGTMAHLLRNRLELTKSRLALFTPERMNEYFRRRLEEGHLRTDDNREQMVRIMNEKLHLFRSKLKLIESELEALSPLAVLKRGYAIVTQGPKSTIVSNAQQLEINKKIAIQFASGSAEAITKTINQEEIQP
ncbi:MAG: exodeoxyribonuclease VII large subunit [Sphaerochaetaceae bacterium]|nr:exodeoxyribonuclease VII large subunit [Sphaerochaetaceae bacterium]MDD4218960.1 exodeoxyribonuclease VII large subunit [Sphaerochaetaceae bacterium]